MTKEEAIKCIDDRMCFGRGKWSEHHKPVIDIYWQAGEMAIKALEAEPHWIPCSERLPEKEGWYFVTVHPDYIVPDSMHTDSLYWLDGKWWFYDYDARVAVWPDPIIAWMPLPEPYKRGEEYE